MYPISTTYSNCLLHLFLWRREKRTLWLFVCSVEREAQKRLFLPVEEVHQGLEVAKQPASRYTPQANWGNSSTLQIYCTKSAPDRGSNTQP